MKFAVLSTSLDPESRSAWLCDLAAAQLRAQGHEVTHLDLRATPLPPFDNDQGPHGCYAHPHAEVYHRAIREADGVFLGVPVYNWGLGSGVKALVELTGSSDAARGLHGAVDAGLADQVQRRPGRAVAEVLDVVGVRLVELVVGVEAGDLQDAVELQLFHQIGRAHV